MTAAADIAEDVTSLFEIATNSLAEPVTSTLLSRRQVIERIMTINPTASVAFLEDFSEQALQTYLDHLTAAQLPRGRMARWIRPGDTPGIVVAEPRD